MNILVYDDENLKSGAVTDLIENGFPLHEIDTAITLKDVKDKIKKCRYHMIIADLETPISRSDETIEKSSGVLFLQYIFESEGEEFYRPDEVVVLTKYADDIELLQLIKKYPVSVLKYQEREGEWGHDLMNRIYDCNRKYENKVDIAVITAVEVEFNAFYQRGREWKTKEIENDSNLYFIADYKNKTNNNLKVLLAKQPRMGMVPAADITSRIINYFHPYCVIMSGICGGNKKEIEVGDILVADVAWDYGSGSMEKPNKGDETICFLPAPEQIHADKMIIKEFRKYSLDDDLKINIRRQCDMTKFKTDIDIKIGGMATGAAVIKNKEFIEKFIKTSNKKYTGIDMETYGMYYTAHQFSGEKVKFVAIKAVTDNADEHKSDEFQEYCARLASNLTNHFIENVTYELLGKI